MALLLDLLVTIVSFAVVAIYAWSLRAHFSSPTMPDGAKLITVLVICTAIAYTLLTWLSDQPTGLQVAGLVLELASLLLFWRAVVASRNARLRYAFDPEGPRGLVTDGPYKWIRHPFYTSYLMFWSGWALSTSSIWAAVPVIVFAAVYIMAARNEEELFATTPMAADYAAYRARTGFLLPRLW
jgi:protein-S-isoprenylcysteine O-methyltransferase Ste14